MQDDKLNEDFSEFDCEKVDFNNWYVRASDNIYSEMFAEEQPPFRSPPELVHKHYCMDTIKYLDRIIFHVYAHNQTLHW